MPTMLVLPETAPCPTRLLRDDRDRLTDLLLAELQWASDGLKDLDRHAAHWDEEGGAFLRQRDKVAGEAALLALLASRAGESEPRLRQAVTRLVERASDRILTTRSEAVLRRFPQTATTLGLGPVVLSVLGRGDDRFDALVRRGFERGLATLSERAPYRMMDARWTFGLLPHSPLPAPDALAALTTLTARPHPLYTMSDDDYAFTHAVFYLTNFGRRQPDPAIRAAAIEALDPFLAWNAIRTDYDLLGELLICSTALSRPPTAADRFAWELFDRAWSAPDGLPGPSFDPVHHADLKGPEADAYAFAENYHTRFVAGILAAVQLAAGPPLEAPAPAAVPDLGNLATRCCDAARRMPGAVHGDVARAAGLEPPSDDDLLEWLIGRLLRPAHHAGAELPLWLTAASETSLTRAELAPVLGDALLTNQAKEYQLTQLAETLAALAGSRLRPSPTFERAATFLLDQQLPDGLVGIHPLLGTAPSPAPVPAAQVEICRLMARIGDRLGSS